MLQTIQLFGEVDFSITRDQLSRSVITKVNSETAAYLLNVNATKYVEHLVDMFRLDPLEILLDNVEVSPTERSVPAERFPPTFFAEPGRRYTKPAFVYHVPFRGDPSLLRQVPNPRIVNTYEVQLSVGEISFEVLDLYGTPENVKQSAERILSYIRDQFGHLDKNIRRFNDDLPGIAKTAFEERKAKLLAQGQLAASLGVPIRMRPDVPTTFAVPSTIRKPITARPGSSAGPYRADLTIDDVIYGEILQTIQDTGRMFERLPNIYSGKDEESLRDHLLMVLEPRFQISSTGETFNKTGKTDILMRHEGKNVFVAECKFWGGAKKHLDTIDQILRYLTFRDSKAAIIYFMRTKEIMAPLDSIRDGTPDHPAFVASKGHKEESWFSYEFHLPGDVGRSVQLAVLSFHLPPG